MRYVNLLKGISMRATWTVLFFLLAVACNTPQKPGSKAQSLEDTTQVQYLPAEGKFFVQCRDGRSHKGSRNALVTKPELTTVCEGPAILDNEMEALPFNTNITQPDINTCEGLTQAAHQLNIAFTPDYIVAYNNLTPTIRKQQLCVGSVGVMNTLAKNTALFKLLVGDTLSAAVLTVLDVPTGAVRFDQSNMMLTIPSKMDATVQLAIESEFAEQQISFCTGKRLDGACWFLGAPHMSCAATCAVNSMVYDIRTQSWAGAGGSDENCQRLADAWALPFNGADDDCFMSGLAVGCHNYLGQGVKRCVGQPTTAEATNLTVKRFCACR